MNPNWLQMPQVNDNEANLLTRDNSHEPSTCAAGCSNESGVGGNGTPAESTSPSCPSSGPGVHESNWINSAESCSSF